MNNEYEYMWGKKIAKSFNEQMDEYLEFERKQLEDYIYNNPPKLVDTEKLKIVTERDNQQRVEESIPQPPKLFDYDSVRMVREDKPITQPTAKTTTTPTPVASPSYNYAQIKPKFENPFTSNTPLRKSYDELTNDNDTKTTAKPIALKPVGSPFEVKPIVKAVNPYTPNTTLWNIHNDLLIPKQTYAEGEPIKTKFFTPPALKFKRENPFTPNSDLWRFYDNILNHKQKAAEVKPINLKLDATPAIKPKVVNTYTPNTPLWEFYDNLINKKYQKPVEKPTTPSENITTTPIESNKITPKQATPNNKPTTPSVKIAEEASSVVTPTVNNNPSEAHTAPLPKKESKSTVKFNSTVKDGVIKISMEKGELQVRDFTRKGNSYSTYELSKELNDPLATMRLNLAARCSKILIELVYSSINFVALSGDDNIQNKVLNAFLNDKRPSIIPAKDNSIEFSDIDTSSKGTSLFDKVIQSEPIKTPIAYIRDFLGIRVGDFVKLSEEESGLRYIYDNGLYIKTLVFDENSLTSKNLKENPIFNNYYINFRNYIEKAILEADKIIKENMNNGINSIETIISNMINLQKDNIFKKDLNFSDYSQILSSDNYALMGGTQKIKTDMTIERRSDGKYTVKTTFYIMDWYGSDNDDIKPVNYEFDKKNLKSWVPFLNAMYYLQNHYGYQPFATLIICTKEEIIDPNEKAKLDNNM